MSIRTDLASEREQQIRVSAKSSMDGVTKSEYLKGNLKITKIDITTEHASQAFGKPQGSYVTITCENGFDSMPDRVATASEALCCELKKLAGKFKTALVVGLGNEAITPDSLGVLV